MKNLYGNEFEADMNAAVKNVKIRLDQISKTFCLAKWYRGTIYLQSGRTHSCYHPLSHCIPLEGLDSNPSMLFNTPYKQAERLEMLNGARVSGCRYCWSIENIDNQCLSDRLINSAYLYSEDRLQRILKDPCSSHLNPMYLEVVFDNICNLKCGYCHPEVSSSYMKEIKSFGPYSMVKSNPLDVDPLKVIDKNNPFLEAFWRWWPDLKHDLKMLRISGGEPLLSESTWMLFDSIIAEPLPELELSINTNLFINHDVLSRLIKVVKNLLKKNCIKTFKLHTSMDSCGRQAEYIRYGLDFAQWEHNLDEYIHNTYCPVEIVSTFNILCVTTIKNLFKKVLEWRAKYSKIIKHFTLSHDHKVRYEVHYLKNPLVYDINLLPKSDFFPYAEEALSFIYENICEGDLTKFSKFEYKKILRIIEYMKNTHYPLDVLERGRRDFVLWFDEHDRRRKTNLLDVFPEYSAFYYSCSKLLTD